MSEQVLHMTLTKTEFAEALGMRSEDLFVQRMFACMTRNGGDSVCFQEFLEILKRFTRGWQFLFFILIVFFYII